MTLPCIVCHKVLEAAIDGEINQPYPGTVFQSGGNYGSTVFDPMDGSKIEINVCDECLVAARDRGDVLATEPMSTRVGLKPWKA